MRNVQSKLIEYAAMIATYAVAMLGFYWLTALLHLSDHDAKLALVTILAVALAIESRKIVRAMFAFPGAVRTGNADAVLDELGATPEERERATSAARRYGNWPRNSRQ